MNILIFISNDLDSQVKNLSCLNSDKNNILLKNTNDIYDVEKLIKENMNSFDIALFIFKSSVGRIALEDIKAVYNSVPNKIKKVTTFFIKTDFNTIDKKELYKILNIQIYLEENKKYYKEVEGLSSIDKYLSKQIELMQKIKNIEPKENIIKISLKENMLLPKKDKSFINRDKKIKEILEKLANKENINLHGVAGVGKTVLATEAAHEIVNSWNYDSEYINDLIFTDGILWIKLEKHYILKDVIEIYIEPQIGINIKSDDIENIKEFLKKILKDKDILIIIDGAGQKKELALTIIEIFKFLTVMLTSRIEFENFENIKINPFNIEEAVELFEKIYNQNLKKKERKKIYKLSKSLGGMPLAISFVAKYAKLHNIDINDLSRFQEKYEGKNTLYKIFEIFYKELSELEKKVFLIASMFKYPFKEEYLLNIVLESTDIKINMINKIIDKLIKINFLKVDKEKIYHFNPLVRKYALQKFNVLPDNDNIREIKRKYIMRLAENRNNLEFIYNELLDTLDEYYENRNYTKFIEGVKKINWWLQEKGLYSVRDRLLEQAIDVVENKKDKYLILIYYGDSLSRQGENELAKEYLEKALEYKEYSKNDCFLYYSYIVQKYRLYDIESAYKENLEYSRECLFYDSYRYSSFYKTNSWITSDYLELNMSLEYAAVNSITKGYRNNKFKSIIDLIRIWLYKKLYKKVIEKSDYILRTYSEDTSFNQEDRVDLLLIKAKSQLFEGADDCIETINYIERNFNILELNEYNRTYSVKILYYLQKDQYGKAEALIKNILDEDEKKFYEGIYNSYLNAEKAIKLLSNTLKNEKNEYKRANIKIYLSKAYLKLNNYGTAVKYYQEAVDFLGKYITPIQEKIVSEIKEKIKDYNNIAKNISIDKIDKSFIIKKEELPKKIVTKDGKTMVLVEQGFSIYGEDNFNIPTLDDILENPEISLSNKKELMTIRYLPSFYIDETPVTNEEYRTYCNNTGKNSNNFNDLTIKQMREYAEYYGKKLPLPEEWEKACRGENNFNYPWGNEWDEKLLKNIKLEDYDNVLNELIDLLIPYKSYKEHVEWFESEKKYTDETNEFFNNFKFSDNITVNKYYFFKMFLNSLSLDIIEKIRVIEAIPTLSQFQVDELIKVFEEEVKKFKELEQEHPEDIKKLFNKSKNQAIDILSEYIVRGGKDTLIETLSPYGVKNMIGNGYEVTLKDNKIVFKGGIFTKDYKEKFKGKTELIEFLTEDNKEKKLEHDRLPKAKFRCVKPIFSWDDLKDVKIIKE